MDEGLDQIPIFEWVKLGGELGSGHDFIKDKDQQLSREEVRRLYPPVGTPEYGRKRHEMDQFGWGPKF